MADKVTETWEKNMFDTDSPGISFLVKIYPELYTRLALMFIDPVTKSYKKDKIESNSILCLGFYLVLTYFILLKKNIDINNKIRRGPTKDAIKEKIEKVVKTIENYATKTFPGIYEFIDDHYKKKPVS
jgi:hypothetical protein